MRSVLPLRSPIISVIITSYNHGQYLGRAIESVLAQSQKELEIIVIDDGSTDNTKLVTESYASVNYVYQSNQGLAAARNKGIDHSNGDYLVFLDADDWLFNNALSVNLKYLKQSRDAAFVFGGHVRINKNKEVIYNSANFVKENHFCHLLQGTYFQMHATVMYQRWIFETFRFDTLLGACEDFDLILKVARKHPILSHPKLIAAYYIHDQNMSTDIPKMLESNLTVLNRQRKFLKNVEEEECLEKGAHYFKDFYCKVLYYRTLFVGEAADVNNRIKNLHILRKYYKSLYLKYLILKLLPIMTFKTFIKRTTPAFLFRMLRKIGIFKSISPAVGKMSLGDLDRTTPFNIDFGYSRGGPVDRYYIETFLQQQAANIKGRVLEIGDNEYTMRFGGSKIVQSDILHIDDKNPKATFIGDLSNAPQLPSDSFDCVILTQTLHLIYSYKEALETCYRILKPGGALLLTVPGISHIDYGEWGGHWMWSFTQNSITRLLSEVFSAENVDVESYGNVLVATAFLYGIGLPEIKREQMDVNDPHYQVVISAVASKSQ